MIQLEIGGVIKMEKKNYSIEFGNRCRQIRMAKGISQQVLADKIGTTPQNISKWEREGISNIDTIMQLSEVLGQDITADEIDQEGSVGEIGKEILALLIERKGYIEWEDLKNSLFGLPENRICNEIFKLERIGDVVREQYKGWCDELRDAIFITAKGIITIKNMDNFIFAGDLEEVISYEVRLSGQLNYNDRIQNDEVSRLIWKLPRMNSAYRVDYIYYLIKNYRTEYPSGIGSFYRPGTGLWAEEYMPAENCYFDTLFFISTGLSNEDLASKKNLKTCGEEYQFDEAQEMRRIWEEAYELGYIYIDEFVKDAQEKFEEYSWVHPVLSSIDKKNKEILGKIGYDDLKETYGDDVDNVLSHHPDPIFFELEMEFYSKVGEKGSKLCDEWFTDSQIIEFIEKNYKPAETEWEHTVDEMISKINRINPRTLEYYYKFPERWETNGLAQKIRDVWSLPSREEYYEMISDDEDE